MFFWGGDTGAKSLFLVFAVTFAGVVFNYNKRPTKSFLIRETILLLWLYGAILVSIVLSKYNIDRAFTYAHEIGKLFLFCCLMILTIDNKKKVQVYEMFMIACFVFLGLWGIDQHFRGNERLEGLGGHAFPDTNGIAAVFVLFLPVALNLVINGKNNINKAGGLVSGLIIIILIICTQSRGGFLGLSVAVITMVLKTKQRFKIIVYGLIFLLALSPFISDKYLARLETIKPSNGQQLESSANSRIYLWQAGLMVFADNIFFGTGFLSYPEAKMRYEYRFNQLDPEFRAYVFREINKKVTHNTYIQLLSDCGLFGFIPFALFLFGTFWQNNKLRNIIRQHNYDIELYNLLNALESGILGYSICIFFIDAVTMPPLPWQVVICAIVRRLLLESVDVVQNRTVEFPA